MVGQRVPNSVLGLCVRIKTNNEAGLDVSINDVGQRVPRSVLSLGVAGKTDDVVGKSLLFVLPYGIQDPVLAYDVYGILMVEF